MAMHVVGAGKIVGMRLAGSNLDRRIPTAHGPTPAAS
jgi:hypothetical protein